MARTAKTAATNETEVKETTSSNSVKDIIKKVLQEDKEMVEVEIPLDKYSDNADYTVAVNGKVTQIQRGEKVKVPRYIAKVIEASMEQDKNTARLVRGYADKFAKQNQ